MSLILVSRDSKISFQVSREGEGPVEEQAYIGELISGIVYFYVGARLLRLAARTGEGPERLLAAMFLFTGVSFLLYDVPIILDSEPLWTPFNFAGRLVYLPAVLLLAIFTHRVFRPEGVWAGRVPYAVAALLVVGVGGSVWHGDLEGFTVSSPWFWVEWTGYTLPFAWAGVEALTHHHRARRRFRLGLCDPLVCNRYLLWGFYGAVQVMVSLALFPAYSEYEHDGAFSATWDTLISAGEISSLALILLIFFPPALYRRWIQGAPAENAASS
jgi:hypothetical protein